LPNDLWTLSLSSPPTWQVIPQTSADLPAGRAYHTAILDPATDRMMVSMGYGSSPLGDSWILQLGTTPTRFPLDSPLTAPAPTFVAPVTGIPATLAVGQTFQMTCSVKNYGGSSDIGRIVASFPSFTDPSDGQWVTTGTSNDTPGYTKQPAGSTLLDIDCQ